RDLLRGVAFRTSIDPEGRRTHNLLLVTALLLGAAYVSPALWQARYNVHLAAGLMFLVAWASGPRATRRIAEGVAAATIITGLVTVWWAKPGWGLDIAGTLDLASRPEWERATLPPAGWSIAPEVAAARERELGPGSVVVFSDDVTFPSVLWNEHYTNRLLYL